MVVVTLNERVTKRDTIGHTAFIVFVLARLYSYVVSYLVV